MPTPTEAYERYEAVFGGVQAPFAFVDLDAVWANAADMLRRSRGKPIRVASKSIRCRPVLERLLDLDPGFQGVLCFTLPGGAVAVGARACATSSSPIRPPTAPALTRLARLTSENPDEAPVVMVDCPEHLDLIEAAATSFVAPVRVAIDIDVSWWPLGGVAQDRPEALADPDRGAARWRWPARSSAGSGSAWSG